ncbi:hypothetical protein OsJ_07859 [Oryza sativa Japonica Group]|uniref:Major facilitator superfamily (MFS) profile domain-containing protein n=1 Tax=Oryza sativa subsp. japonica TaxID=39947 RepID=B9F1J5_ORYSJ|nr:hypothetical protein OsJ_07859 [Oryza sativa Japonica Group]
MKDLAVLGHLFVAAFMFHFASYMVIPAITDVTMDAVCPGRDECSVAIYLSGFQSAITGMGALVVTPIVGNLSDKYGRKALMTLPVTVAILPLFILACNRSKVYFYVYYVVKVLAGIFCEGSMHCLLLAYVVAAAVAAATAIYLRAVVPDSGGANSFVDEACDPFLQGSSCSAATSSSSSSDEEISPRLPPHKGGVPSLSDMVSLLTGSLTLSGAAIVTFFYSLGEHGLQTALLYYLKAQFGYSKDEFANLLLIAGAAGMLSQLTVMPVLARFVGEDILLIIGLLGGCTHVFLYGIAWSYWVPYLSAVFIILSAFVHPSIRTNVSKSVGSNEQGIAQGCISGISSFASILAPLIFTPLTAWVLSETAPFKFKGFSIMCAGFCTLIAFIISMRMRAGQSGASEMLAIVQHEQA